jgi:hypothetical protein
MGNSLRRRSAISAACILILSLFGGKGEFRIPTALAAAGIPRILNHQGRLYNSVGTALGGSGTQYCFRFSLYDDAAPGGGDNKLWPSGSPSTMTVMVRNGAFSANIGDVAAGGDTLDYDFESSDTAYLNVDVATKVGATCASGDGAESFETLSPRQRIVAAGYALNSATLRGFTPSQNASSSNIPVLSSGNLTLGGTNPQINATGSNALVFQGGGGTGDLRFFNASNTLSAAGALSLQGGITAASLSASGAGIFGSVSSTAITFTNATGSGSLAANSLAIIGSGTFGTVSSTAITFTTATGTGNLGIGTLNVSGQSSLGSVSSTILQVSGAANFQGFTFVNATGTGNVQAASLLITGAGLFGSVSSTALTFTNATGTNLTVTNCVGCSPFTVSSTFTYLSSTTQDMVLGGNDPNNATFYMDVSRGTLVVNNVLQRQHWFREDFAKDRADVTADSNTWGDNQAVDFDEIGQITLSILDDTNNGISRCTNMVASEGCRFSLSGPTAGSNANYIYNAANQPSAMFQLRPGVVGANNDIFVGFSDLAADTTSEPTNGAYFSNENGTDWTPVLKVGATKVTGTCPGGTISTTNFALLRIQVRSNTTARFWIDPNTSDGLTWTDCGIVTIGTSLSDQLSFTVFYKINTGGSTADFDWDFIGVAQDDPVTPVSESASLVNLPIDLTQGADLAEAYLSESGPIEPGTVVSLAETGGGKIRPSNSAYEKHLFGVVSTAPHIVMGSERDGEETARIALIGRVPVKVNVENGPILPGDWLTASSRPGEAMKATTSGMVLGRALEAYDGTASSSKILAFVNTEDRSAGGESSLRPVSELVASAAAAASSLAQRTSSALSGFFELVADQIVSRVAVIGKLFANDISILPGGSISLPSGENGTAGHAMLTAGESRVFISHAGISVGSKILLTPTTALSIPLAVVEKKSGEGFTVALPSGAMHDIEFDWILLQSDDIPSTPTVAPSVITSQESTPSPGAVPPAGGDASPPPEEAPPTEESAEPPPEEIPPTEEPPDPVSTSGTEETPQT